MRKTKIRNLAAGISFLGFMLMLTERGGLPWAGTYIGLAMLILGALAALNIHKINHKEGRTAKNGKQDQIHLRVYRRPAGQDDAA